MHLRHSSLTSALRIIVPWSERKRKSKVSSLETGDFILICGWAWAASQPATRWAEAARSRKGSEEVMRWGNHAKLSQDGGAAACWLTLASWKMRRERDGSRFCVYRKVNTSRCTAAAAAWRGRQQMQETCVFYLRGDGDGGGGRVAAPATHWFSDAINTIMPSFPPSFLPSLLAGEKS